jgi:hypothetical protein
MPARRIDSKAMNRPFAYWEESDRLPLRDAVVLAVMGHPLPMQRGICGAPHEGYLHASTVGTRRAGSKPGRAEMPLGKPAVTGTDPSRNCRRVFFFRRPRYVPPSGRPNHGGRPLAGRVRMPGGGCADLVARADRLQTGNLSDGSCQAETSMDLGLVLLGLIGLVIALAFLHVVSRMASEREAAARRKSGRIASFSDDDITYMGHG